MKEGDPQAGNLLSSASPMESVFPVSTKGFDQAQGCGQSLYTHHHFGWRRHDLRDASEESLLEALLQTHGFLAEYEGRYRVEISATAEYSFDGIVSVYWDSEEPKHLIIGAPLRRGDHWFRAFEFNVAATDACRYCGGTGVDHYVGPFFHCWACDGTALQIRESTPRGFMHKPTRFAGASADEKYAAYLAAHPLSQDQP